MLEKPLIENIGPVSKTSGGNGIHVIQELMNRADQRGYVTFEDVLELLDEDSDDVNAIESVLDELDELGIELRQHESDHDADSCLLYTSPSPRD